MKSNNSTEIMHKDVVVIGNGPSGLALSYMLSGNLPYLVSNAHPDELLSARLSMVRNQSLVHEELGHLAAGLEGRSTNPISLLLDALSHPYADIGLELESLIEWRKDGVEIDHVVLGKGPPGGSWHQMDPHILTLSLGSWMALPGLPYKARDGSEKRASAGNVARYYVQYMNELKLGKYFKNGVCVTNVKQLNPTSPEHGKQDVDSLFGEYCSHVNGAEKRKEYLHNKWVERVEEDVCERTKLCSTPETEESAQVEQRRKKLCSLSNAFNFIRLRSSRTCKRRRDCLLKNDLSPDRKIRELLQKSTSVDESRKLQNTLRENKGTIDAEQVPLNIPSDDLCRGPNKVRSISFSCDYDNFESSCDSLCSKSFNEQGSFINSIRNSYSLDFNSSITKVPEVLKICDNDSLRLKENCDPCTSTVSKYNRDTQTKWLIETYDTITGKYVTYIAKHLVLANGASDLPNRLTICGSEKDPAWLVHDVRSLEMQLDNYRADNSSNPDPVLVIGAGLSAADAIIATRGRNIPVLHMYRNKTSDLSKQLPENMYPEYHKVHQMMQDGGSSYPLYKALPECSLTRFNESERTVTLTSKSGDELKFHVSFAAVLIGARPDLNFLPQHFTLGVDKKVPIDSKTNNIDINKLTHSVSGFEGLYAMGPLAGDNFVRFIPGGALAIVSDLYREYGF